VAEAVAVSGQWSVRTRHRPLPLGIVRRVDVAGETELTVWYELIRRPVVDEPRGIGRYRQRVDGAVDGEHGRRRRRSEAVADHPRTGVGAAVEPRRVVEME